MPIFVGRSLPSCPTPPTAFGRDGLLFVFPRAQVNGVDDALGICASWHCVTQDVDFERKLLLRALLQVWTEYGEMTPHQFLLTPDE